MSSKIFVAGMQNEMTINTLVRLMAEQSYLITLKVDLNMLVEFAVAAKILRARSVSSLLHECVLSKITEAKSKVSSAEFQRHIEDQTQETLARSKAKSEARKRAEQNRILGGEVNLQKQRETQRKYKSK